MKINKWYVIVLATAAVLALVTIKFVLPNMAYVNTAANLTSGDPIRIAESLDFESLRKSLLEQYRLKKMRKRASGTQSGQTVENAESDQDSENLDQPAEDAELGAGAQTADNAEVSETSSSEGDAPVEELNPLDLPLESSNLAELLDPLIDEDKQNDARVQAMINDVLSPNGINRLLKGELTHYNNLAREVFPPQLVNMATSLTPNDARILLQNAEYNNGPDGTTIMTVDLPQNNGRVTATLQRNGGSYQIIDLKLPQ